MSKEVEVTFEDNEDVILEALERAGERCLSKLGATAEAYAKGHETAIDTGRLRNSITYATREFSGVGVYEDNDGKVYSDGNSKQTPEEKAVYIGTNVEYAPRIELGGRRNKAIHFMKKAIENHQSKYRTIIKDELKS